MKTNSLWLADQRLGDVTGLKRTLSADWRRRAFPAEWGAADAPDAPALQELPRLEPHRAVPAQPACGLKIAPFSAFGPRDSHPLAQITPATTLGAGAGMASRAVRIACAPGVGSGHTELAHEIPKL